jgi:uncharacterized protein
MVKAKVWVDVLTPKQVLLFAPVVRELRDAGCDVMATSRRYREVEPLAERASLNLIYVGERGAKGPEEQLLAATKRQAELIPIVKKFQPNVAVSVASAVCARISFGLRVKHMAVNDSPHSQVAGRLSLPLTYRLLCPWVIPYEAWAPFGLQRRQVAKYRALDAAVWLKRKPIGGPVPKLDRGRKTITVRVQESDAPYLAEADTSWTDAVLGSLSEAFQGLNLVALCRYDYQVEDVRRKFGSKWVVPDEVVDGQGLLAATDLFVGMGGTMSAEAALMGVPTISAFQGSLFTDDYLKSVGLLAKVRSPQTLLSRARRYLEGSFKSKHSAWAKKILDSMEDPVPKIAGNAKKIAEQG